MTRRSVPTVLVIVSCLALVLQGFAQEEVSGGSEEAFRSALSHYREGRVEAALIGFTRILSEYPQSPQFTAALIMRGRSLFRLGEMLEAARSARLLLSDHPASLYRADAHLLLGQTYARIGRSYEAFRELLAAWEERPVPAPAPLEASVLAAIDTLVEREISVPGIRDALSVARDPSIRAYLWIKIGEKEWRRENMLGLSVALDTVTERYEGHPFASQFAALQAQLAGTEDLTLAALVPLMEGAPPSVTRQIAQDILAGIEYAVDESALNPEARSRVRLTIHDSGRDPARADSLVRLLAEERKTIAVIGPVFSATAMTAAVAAQTSGIPLVTPTANANGIAAAGEYVFQVNPDYETRGRAMAHYVVRELGMTRVAVLAPSQSYGKYQADGFLREARRLGATVVAEAWYPKGGADLKEQFTAIRRGAMIEQSDPMISFAGKLRTLELMQLMNLGIPKRRLDSLMSKSSILPAKDLLGKNARRLMDSLGLAPAYDLARLDSVQYPVTGIQAIYLPIGDAEEIGVLSSQFAYYNIDARMFGSGEWNDIPSLHEHKRYCSGVTFEADSHVDTSRSEVRAFESGFLARFGRRPSRNAYYGYDAAQLVNAAIRGGAATRSGLVRALSQVEDFRSLHTRIGFSGRRVNSWLTILRYDDDTISRVGEVKVE